MVPTAFVTGAVFCLISANLCLLTGGILLLYSGRSRPDLYLGLSYLAFGYAFTIAGLTYSHLIYYAPHLYRTGNICWLLCMPLSWLYIRTSVRQKPPTAWDIFHLLPVVLYIVDYSPFFFSTGSYKTAIIQAEVLNLNQMIRYKQGWLLPVNSQIPIRAVQAMVYWVLQIALLMSRGAAVRRKDRPWFRWIVFYIVLQVPMFLPTLIAMFTGVWDYLWASTIPPVAASLLSSVTLYLNPRILYGLSKIGTQQSARPKHPLDHEFVQRLSTRLETVMREEKPFLNADFTLKKLADAVGVPLYKLSAYINQTTGSNFSEYLNHWRIRYCLELIREKKIVNLNLHGIATKCGFNNRNTFSSAFKKVTGQAPSVYLQMNV